MSNPPGNDPTPWENPTPRENPSLRENEADQADEPAAEAEVPGERRFTAPGFDAGSTQIIDRTPDPETEIISTPTEVIPISDRQPRTAPQEILPRGGAVPVTRSRSWGWVIALILVAVALAAVAILVIVLLTRDTAPQASQEDLVRATIEKFDTAVQKGDLAMLRGITCGQTRDNYVEYDDRTWTDTHARVSAAKQYPVVASIDEVVVNGDHAEANVTSFMAFDPATRSVRSFDLQFRDNEWKICQSG